MRVRESREHSRTARVDYAEFVETGLSFCRRFLRAVRIAATDKRIPRPLRWLAALGLLPIPGPFDEALLVLVAVPLALFYRRRLADAWAAAADPERSA